VFPRMMGQLSASSLHISSVVKDLIVPFVLLYTV